MITIRPKIRNRVNFTHYGLKLLIGGGTKGDNALRHDETDRQDSREPEKALTETITIEVKR